MKKLLIVFASIALIDSLIPYSYPGGGLFKLVEGVIGGAILMVYFMKWFLKPHP